MGRMGYENRKLHEIRVLLWQEILGRTNPSLNRQRFLPLQAEQRIDTGTHLGSGKGKTANDTGGNRTILININNEKKGGKHHVSLVDLPTAV